MSSFTRQTTLLSALRRTLVQKQPRTLVPSIQQRFESQGYGDGEGSPKGEKPQDQGASASSDKEHPGPPPPKAGEGSGGSPTKGTSEGHTKVPSQDKGQQSRSFSTLRTLWSEKRPKSTEGLSPKILDESPPSKEEESDEVKQHNKDIEGRSERAHEGVTSADAEKDKISLKKLQNDEGNNEKEGPKDEKAHPGQTER